jgi:hypothetical protein
MLVWVEAVVKLSLVEVEIWAEGRMLAEVAAESTVAVLL